MRYSFILLICLVLSSCTHTSNTDASLISEKYTVTEFQSKINELDSEIVLDVRTPEEIAENGKMASALNYDYYADDFERKIAMLDKTQPVMIYCKSGGRSAEVMDLLGDLGFEEVYDLAGGYDAWLKEKGE